MNIRFNTEEEQVREIKLQDNVNKVQEYRLNFS
mgnify:CR=1 FL=1